jgi:hypothetical protein
MMMNITNQNRQRTVGFVRRRGTAVGARRRRDWQRIVAVLRRKPARIHHTHHSLLATGRACAAGM